MKTTTQPAAATPKAFPAAAYVSALRGEIDRVLDLMEKTWEFRPPVELNLELCLVASADFNLKDFAHKGSKKYVRASTAAGRCKPRRIARAILGEIVFHRDTCARCGTGLPTLYNRVQCLRAFLDPRSGRQTFQFIPPDAESKDDGHGHKYRPYRTVTPADVERWFLAPADAVERELFPGMARRLDALIAEWGKEKETRVGTENLPVVGNKSATACQYQAPAGCQKKYNTAAEYSAVVKSRQAGDPEKGFLWQGLACGACVGAIVAYVKQHGGGAETVHLETHERKVYP
jgi:hypothetical protein